MSIEEKFNAAVDVVQGLPKDGAFQPSQDMKLRFYGLFKQAMMGRCNEPKPAFYSVVAGYKWRAWSQLGDMSEKHAMEEYVSELKKIVETMSYSADVATFMEILGPFYQFVDVSGTEDGGIAGIENGDSSEFTDQESTDSDTETEALVHKIDGEQLRGIDESGGDGLEDSIEHCEEELEETRTSEDTVMGVCSLINRSKLSDAEIVHAKIGQNYVTKYNSSINDGISETSTVASSTDDKEPSENHIKATNDEETGNSSQKCSSPRGQDTEEDRGLQKDSEVSVSGNFVGKIFGKSFWRRHN